MLTRATAIAITAIGCIACTTEPVALVDRGSERATRRDARGGWSEVVIDDGRARVAFPGATEHSASEVDTEAGRVEHGMDLWEHGDDSFAASHWTLPQRRLAEGTTVESVLEGSRDGVLRSLSATLVSEEWTVAQGCPALDVRLVIDSDPEGGAVWSRLMLCGLRGYQLMAVGRSEADQRRFIESFRRLRPIEPPLLPRRRAPG